MWKLGRRRWKGGQIDPVIDAEMDALDHAAAEIIRAQTDATVRPLEARIDAAIAEAHRLLGWPPPPPRTGAGEVLEGDTAPSRATPPRRS